MKKIIKVALVSHIIKDDNLGCGALAISNIRLLDQVFKELDINVEYVIAITDNLEQVELTSFTKNSYEYRIYPRCKQSLKKPLGLLNTKVFKGCDIVFNLCGGDGYADIYGFGRLLAESQLAWIAKKNGIPIVYAPQTIGPFETLRGRFLAKHTLGIVKHIFVRDHTSYKCCEKLGLSSKSTEVIDVAFALPYEKSNFAPGKTNIGINVSGLLYNGGYDRKNYFGLSFSYRAFIEKLLEQLCRSDRYVIHLVAHVNSYGNPIEDDYSVCDMLAQKYSCVLAPRFESPIAAKTYISGLDLFTGARMHSTIGAISSGVPVIPVAYSRKFNGLYSSLGYPWLIDAKSNLTVDEAVKVFFDYVDKKEFMLNDVDKAKEVYISRLKQYQEYLKEVLWSII